MAGDTTNEERNPGVLHLGEVRADATGRVPADPGEPPAAHPRRRWMIAVAVFLVGALVGSYTWLARSDLLDSATVDLIVIDVIHDAPHSDGTLTSVTAQVRNIGSDDLTITDANVPGQPSSGDRDVQEVAVPAGEAAMVAVNGELNCGTGLPDVIEAELRTPAGETSAELPVPATNIAHFQYCGSLGEVWVENVAAESGAAVMPEISDSGMVVNVPLSIRSWSVDEVEVVDVAVSAGAGMDVEPSGLVGLHETRTIAELRLEWTVTDCSDAYQVEPVDITVTFAEHPPVSFRAHESVLPVLASLPDLVCES